MRTDRVLVVDIEATCWKNNRTPTGMQPEIVEIGICALDLKAGQTLDPRGLIVKPTRSTMSDFCTRLTGLTPAMLSEGTPFSTACSVVETTYAAKDHLWVSWGGYDLRKFKSQCPDFGVPYPFSEAHVDLKGVFREAYTLRKRIGMARAMEHAGIDLIGRHHRGVDDAVNIARLLWHLINVRGVAIFEPHWRSS